MNSQNQQNWQSQQLSEEDILYISSDFTESVARVNKFVLAEFEREVIEKQLYYHTKDHLMAVQQRAQLIFQVIRPYLSADVETIKRMELLLDVCAIAHDLVQIFIPHQPHTSRRREAGVSENATIEILLNYIQVLNQEISAFYPKSTALFTDTDLEIIQEAIAATICDYDTTEQAIYQPSLYNQSQPISPVACIIALADIGSLGIEGIPSYNQEGSLLFLEDNPDIIPIIKNQNVRTLATDNPELYENIRQRLLRRAKFQVNFAKSRLNRLSCELASLPADAIPTLTQAVFQYLNLETIQEIKATTPTNEQTSLEVLIKFFEFERLIKN
ncbi:hypothetical protein NIES4072_69840 [Nostoc commune NIES-4072]|uniref:HD domain-containing protein n=1 Tax=Nostoc commune NIES-4072 TaxID=2005467 RepID=A0A2R5FWY7_NOSCO|nr:hypothetical protein [Nostoc commune]BBD70617.1 hypothetical protein NIES4070_70280 [Nostoc commune HK-02]GBG23272.1 hypothetical protein NIES4072_69840 [Nostoc commune NIES-4072]